MLGDVLVGVGLVVVVRVGFVGLGVEYVDRGSGIDYVLYWWVFLFYFGCDGLGCGGVLVRGCGWCG